MFDFKVFNHKQTIDFMDKHIRGRIKRHVSSYYGYALYSYIIDIWDIDTNSDFQSIQLCITPNLTDNEDFPDDIDINISAVMKNDSYRTLYPPTGFFATGMDNLMNDLRKRKHRNAELIRKIFDEVSEYAKAELTAQNRKLTEAD